MTQNYAIIHDINRYMTASYCAFNVGVKILQLSRERIILACGLSKPLKYPFKLLQITTEQR